MGTNMKYGAPIVPLVEGREKKSSKESVEAACLTDT